MEESFVATRIAIAAAVVAISCTLSYVRNRWSCRRPSAVCRAVQDKKKEGVVVVVGSVNVDLFCDVGSDGSIRFNNGGKYRVSGVKGMTLPADSFAEKIVSERERQDSKFDAEAFVLGMRGPFEQRAGGKGANTAFSAAQSCAGEFLGCFGASSTKDNATIQSDMIRGGVNIGRAITIPGKPTGTAFILRYPGGDNGIVLIGGANQRWPVGPSRPASPQQLSDPVIAKVKTALRGASVLMLQREIPKFVNTHVAKIANELSVPVLLDVGGSEEPVDADLIPYVSVVMPNESELEWISGTKVTSATGKKISISRLRNAVAALKRTWAEKKNDRLEVLVTLGSLGAMYFEAGWTGDEPSGDPKDGRDRRPTFDVLKDLGVRGPDIHVAASRHPFEHRVGIFPVKKEIVDTTGAGDCFRGSFAAARFSKRRSIPAALKYASAAASLCVTKAGAMPSMPKGSEVVAHLEANRGGCSLLAFDA
eukprot:g633.t1